MYSNFILFHSGQTLFVHVGTVAMADDIVETAWFGTKDTESRVNKTKADISHNEAVIAYCTSPSGVARLFNLGGRGAEDMTGGAD